MARHDGPALQARSGYARKAKIQGEGLRQVDETQAKTIGHSKDDFLPSGISLGSTTNR